MNNKLETANLECYPRPSSSIQPKTKVFQQGKHVGCFLLCSQAPALAAQGLPDLDRTYVLCLSQQPSSFHLSKRQGTFLLRCEIPNTILGWRCRPRRRAFDGNVSRRVNWDLKKGVSSLSQQGLSFLVQQMLVEIWTQAPNGPSMGHTLVIPATVQCSKHLRS